MTTTTVDIEQRTRDFYREIDANDPEVFTRRFVQDSVFTFNDIEPVIGADAISAFVTAWKNNFEAILHQLDTLTIDTVSDRVGTEISVTYVFPDGRNVSVKGSSFIQFVDGSISRWSVYVDKSNLS